MPHTADSMADWTAYLTHPEIAFLKKLANMLPPDPVVVNIGAGSGTSSLAFMEARADLILFSIDIRNESSPFGCLASEIDYLTQAGYLPTRTYTPITGNSHSVANIWNYGPVDMVFIDDGHEYEECRGDIRLWTWHLRSGGIMAVHDYQKSIVFAYRPAHLIVPWPGVDRAVDENLVGEWEEIGRADSLIAFYKPGEYMRR